MKQLIAIIGITVLTFGANAQIDGGTIITGGFANFNNRSYANSSTSSSSVLTIQPQFGLAFADNFVAGAWFSMQSLKNASSWSVSPFLRYYFKNAFIQAGYGYAYNKSNNISSEGAIIDFELGYAAFLTDNVALEPAFYYNGGFSDNKYQYTDIGFKLGFQIYLNRD